MVEQVNSGSGSSSTVEMDTVLELLEKTVLLIVFSTLYRCDRIRLGGGVIVYIRDDIPNKQLIKH